MPDDPGEPPAEAISLADFFVADPQLLETQQQAQQRLEAAKAAIPPCPPTLAYDAWYNLPEIRAARETYTKASNEFEEARRATYEERHNRLVSGEWSTWGREGSPVGAWRLLPADAWRYVRFDPDNDFITMPASPPRRLYFDNYLMTVPGPPPLKFYSVVVARRADTRRGRPSLKNEDAPALAEMDRILKADPALSSRDHRRIAKQLIDDGWVDLAGATPESVIRRLIRLYRCTKLDG
jgi:hypothetical protein